MSNVIPRIEFALQSLFVQQSSCPYCHSKDLRVVSRKYPTIPVKRCSQCLLCFTSPIYLSRISGSLYGGLYTEEGMITSMPGLPDLEHMKQNNVSGTQKDLFPMEVIFVHRRRDASVQD